MYTWLEIYENDFYIHYHLLSHMPKRQTMICTQTILQWDWFAIDPFLWYLNFHIFFLWFNNFTSKGNIFFIVKQITLFCKCNDIHLLITALRSSELWASSLFLLDSYYLYLTCSVTFSPCELSELEFSYAS